MMFYLICWVRHQSDLLTYVLCEVTDERLIHTGACLWWHTCYFIPEVNRTWFPSALQIYFIYLLFRCVIKKCLKGSHLCCDIFYHFGLSPLTFLYTPLYTSMSLFTCYLYKSGFFFSMAQVHSGPQLSDKLCSGMGAPVIQSRESTVSCLSVCPHRNYWSIKSESLKRGGSGKENGCRGKRKNKQFKKKGMNLPWDA